MENKPKKTPRRRFLYRLFAALIVILIVINIPLPYYLEVPGTADSLNEVVEVNQKKDTDSGSFYMTTVGVLRANVANLIAGKLNPFVDIVSKEELFGGADSKEYDMMQKYYLESSQNNAQMMALKKANLPYKMVFKGVYVMEIVKESDFFKKLAVGDLITAVDGKYFTSSQELIHYVKSKKAGDTIQVTYERDDKKETVEGKLVLLKDQKKPSIGIHLIDHTKLEVPNYKIQFNLENVGGPSAGMMFTLELYSLLANKDLKKGRQIAGTGTMEMDGTIGRIGGIDKKVYAANKAGIEIFLAPDDTIESEMKKEYPEMKSNYQEALEAAKKLDSKIKIVPVKTLDEAIQYLEK